jgi:hypothetical protein
MIFNKKIANVILLAPKSGVVILGRNTVRWESHVLYLRDWFSGERTGKRETKITVFIDNIKIGVYDIKWLREYAKG